MSGRRQRRFLAVVLAAAGAALCGCPPPPRPPALDDLHAMLGGDVVGDAETHAADAVAAARATQAQAEAAWLAGDTDRASRLALVAQVQVRLAVALARQALARDRQGDAERTLADAEASYRDIEARRQVLEARLARLWAYRRVQDEVAHERAQAVEEEALRADRLAGPERAVWETNWRAQARADAAEARRTLEVARMLGVQAVYPEAERMAADAISTAVDAVGTSPWRIERPLVDYALAQADELRFRMLTIDEDGGAEAMAERVRGMVDVYRTGFDPPFQVSLDPRGVLLTIDARVDDLAAGFPESARTAVRDLRAKWSADPALLCLAIVRSLDPACGADCVARTGEQARRAAAEVSGVAVEQIAVAGAAEAAGAGGAAVPADAGADRVRALGLGFVKEEQLPGGLTTTGAIRIEFLLFPSVTLPDNATAGHTEPVAAGSQ